MNPLHPGTRNQYNAGLQQAIGRYLVASADYFWKYTHNAYDFGTVAEYSDRFPISWRKSKLDGVAVRSGPRTFTAFWYTTMGHTRARYFGPETGGLFSTRLGGEPFSASITIRHFSRRPTCGISRPHRAVDLIHLAI